MKRIAIVLVGLAAAGSVAFFAWRQIGAAEPGLVLYGNVDVRSVDVGFRVAGRIAEMAVEEGERVAAGQRLAALDDTPYRQGVAAAEAEAAAARADAQKAEAGTRPQEIEQARASLKERDASLANAVSDFERAKELLKRGNVSRSVYDNAAAALEEARARQRAAQEALDLAMAGFRAEDVAAAKARLEAAEAAAARARTDLADTLLAAPEAARVLTRVREPGAVVGSGATVYSLALDAPVRVRAFVDEPDLGLIAPGMAVEVTSDSHPDRRYRGRIAFISPTAEFTPRTVETRSLRTSLVYRLRVIVEDGEGLLQGMPVTVHVPDRAS
ncbi:MAG: efflux RND transporter periplasmic adaptor subunit [Alphaproteobacteria bacterium]|nr:efflux RND transporter periplasmic adaptor subunit [Alphaproteobacteria bacterium]